VATAIDLQTAFIIWYAIALAYLFLVYVTRTGMLRSFFFSENFNLSVSNWRQTIAIPIILSIALVSLLSFITSTPLEPLDRRMGIYASLAFQGFASPVGEEVFFRGLCVGGILSVIGAVAFRAYRKYQTRLEIAVVALVASLFALVHENVTLAGLLSGSEVIYFSFRFLPGLLYGWLYLKNGRNLLPAILAHSSTNVFTILAAFNAQQ
jgi:membrane protease YdiL (CAAX protease family)